MTFWEFINKYYDCYSYITVDMATTRLKFPTAVKFVPFWMIRKYGNNVVEFKQMENLSSYEKTFEVTIRDKDA